MAMFCEMAAVLGAFDGGLGVTVQEELAVLQMRLDVNAELN